MLVKELVQETVFNNSKYGGDGWPPEDAAGFLAWFNDRIESIPPVLRTSAIIRLDADEYHSDENYATIKITYVREETDNEANNRVNREEFARHQQEIRERQMFANLQAKYGHAQREQK